MRETSLLPSYTRALRKYPALTEEAEQQIREAMRQGDKGATAALVAGSLRLVYSVAMRYTRSNPQHVEDLIAVGNLAAFEAAKEFDIDSPGRFADFLYWRLRGAFSAYLAGLRGLSKATAAKYRRIVRVRQDLADRIGRTPSPAEVGAAADCRAELVERVLVLQEAPEAVEDGTRRKDDPDRTHIELLVSANPEAHAIRQQEGRLVASMADRLRQQLAELPQREREIVQATGASRGASVTKAKLCERFGISRTRVMVLRRRSVNRLRASLTEAG